MRDLVLRVLSGPSRGDFQLITSKRDISRRAATGVALTVCLLHCVTRVSCGDFDDVAMGEITVCRH